MSLSKTLKEEVMTLNYCETKIRELEEEITLLEKRLQEESLCLSFLEKIYIEDTIGEYRDLIAKLVIKKHEIEEYPCIKINLVDSFKMRISYKEKVGKGLSLVKIKEHDCPLYAFDYDGVLREVVTDTMLLTGEEKPKLGFISYESTDMVSKYDVSKYYESLKNNDMFLTYADTIIDKAVSNYEDIIRR